MIQSETLELLEWSRLCQQLSTFAATKLGMMAAQRLVIPTTQAESEALLTQTKEMYHLETTLVAGLKFDGLEDIWEPLERAERKGILSGDQLLNVATTFAAARTLRRTIDAQDDVPVLQALVAELRTYPELEQEIHRCIDDQGNVTDRANPQLSGIRQKIKEVRDRIRTSLQRMMQRHSGAMQETVITQRGDRFVLPIKAAQKDKIPGVVHDASASGATLYVEPQAVISLGNQLRQALRQEQAQEEKIRSALTAKVAEIIPDIERLLLICTTLDLASARARYSLWLEANPPRFIDRAANERVVLRQLRHPLLVWQQQHEEGPEVVPINVNIQPHIRVVAITGPNTGGKTVTLKTLGITSIMAKVGLFIPAREPVELPWFDQILADIGDEQSLQQSLSTFSGHIRRISRILDALQPSSIETIDEPEPQTLINEDEQLAEFLHELDPDAEEPTPSPSQEGKPTPGPSQEGKPTPGPSQEGKPTPSPSQEGKPTPGPSQEGKPTPGPSQEGEPTPGPSQEGEPTPGPSQEGKLTPGPSQEGKPTPGPSQEGEPTPGPSQEGKPTPGPSQEGDRSLQIPQFSNSPTPQLSFQNPKSKIANLKSLVLLDEVGAGTDPTEGSALAIALLQHLANHAHLTIATTHFGELKSLKYEDERFENASVEFDDMSMSPTYRLLWGIPGRSNALAIASRLGLDESVIAQARQQVGLQSNENVNEVIAGLEEQRREQEQKAKEANELVRQAEQLHDEVLRKANLLKKREKSLQRQQEKDIQNAISQAKGEIAKVIRTLQKGPAKAQDAQKATNDLDRIEERQKRKMAAKKKKKVGYEPKVGDRVRIPRIDQIADVLSLPDDDGEISVRFGLMKMTVSLEDVESLQGVKAVLPEKEKPAKITPEKKVPLPDSKPSQPTVRTSHNTLDLRGNRVADAEIEIDRAIASSPGGPLWIIHGHGTGKLRKGVHAILKQHAQVDRFEPAEKADGGSGVTIAHIR